MQGLELGRNGVALFLLLFGGNTGISDGMASQTRSANIWEGALLSHWFTLDAFYHNLIVLLNKS
jgi:hypothetical protein